MRIKGLKSRDVYVQLQRLLNFHLLVSTTKLLLEVYLPPQQIKWDGNEQYKQKGIDYNMMFIAVQWSTL